MATRTLKHKSAERAKVHGEMMYIRYDDCNITDGSFDPKRYWDEVAVKHPGDYGCYGCDLAWGFPESPDPDWFCFVIMRDGTELHDGSRTLFVAMCDECSWRDDHLLVDRVTEQLKEEYPELVIHLPICPACSGRDPHTVGGTA